MVGIAQQASSWLLSGDLIVENITQVLGVSKALTLSNPTQLDFAAVTDVDTAAISLVLEFMRRATAENVELSLVNVPEDLVSLMQLYGVDGFVLPN